MGIRSIMVDRARVVRREKSGAKVEGASTYGDVRSVWFPARLDIQSEDVVPTGARGRSVVQGTQLIVGRDVDVTSDDRVEVESRQLGHNLFVVAGDPIPLRKRRRVIGYTLKLQRVDVHAGHA